MWDETNQSTDADCESLQLAVKIGILGIMLQTLWTLSYTNLMMINAEMPSTASITMAMNNLNALGIIHAVFVSVGFVAIFAMKGSKLGIVYPLMVILYRLWGYLYARISYALDMYSAEFHFQSGLVLIYAILIIGGLLLITIRDRSANEKFFTIFVIIYLVREFIASAIWLIIFRGPIPIITGFDVLITSLPDLLVGFAFAILTILFFIIESRQGCIGQDNMQVISE